MVNIIDTVTDAVAIKIINSNVILLGRGNDLIVVSRNDNSTPMKCRMSEIRLSNKIHGIVGDQATNTILIYGNKEFALLHMDYKYSFQEYYKAQLTDWISEAKFLTNVNEMILLTAHNILLRFKYEYKANKKGACTLLEKVSCTDKSTLYCAYLCGHTWQDLIVFGGNAFGELLIWKPCVNVTDSIKYNFKTSSLLHCVAAHKGVIFSICYDEASKLLVTTSDDRSLKWWKVVFTDECDWVNCLLKPLSNNYGHTARVFRGLIIQEGREHYALSIGEDSYLCLWHSSGELIFKRRQQFGAIIWNLDYDNVNKMVYTVGSCGNIVGFPLRDALQNWRKSNIIEQSAWNKNVSKDMKNSNYITKIKFLNAYELICITSDNYLIQLSCRNLPTDSLSHYLLIDELTFNCIVLEVTCNRIALGGHQRFLMFTQDVSEHKWKKVQDYTVLSGIIRAIFFLTAHMYLLSDDRGNCVINDLHELKNSMNFTMPKSKESWLTAALWLNDDYLVVSNRQGHLLLYKNYQLKQTIRQVHGNFGATKLELRQENKNWAIFYTMGRNNILNVISVDFVSSKMKLCTKKTIPIAWVENMIPTNYLSQLYVGFNNSNFVVWSSEYDTLIQIPCGGGHRCWDVSVSNKITLAFIKNKKLFTYTQDMENFKPMLHGPILKRWHIKSCNIMEVIHNEMENFSIVVTGGEDNLLRVHQITHLGLGFEAVAEYHGHISNIKAVKMTTLSANEILIFSAGGRAQLCVTKLFPSISHIEEIINYTLKANNPNSVYNHFPDTRITTLDILSSSRTQNKFKIYIGCSDGYIRCLQFYLDQVQIELLSELYCNKCILHVKVLQEEKCVVVATTDGNLKLYNTALDQCLFNVNLHKSGINALDISYSAQTNRLKILSGGDDQAVSYTELVSCTTQNTWQIVYQFRKAFWHNAQVTAVCLHKNGLYGITCGLDQIVYKINLLKGEIIESACSTISDIKGLSMWYHKFEDYILIYGCGYQILSFNE